MNQKKYGDERRKTNNDVLTVHFAKILVIHYKYHWLYINIAGNL